MADQQAALERLRELYREKNEHLGRENSGFIRSVISRRAANLFFTMGEETTASALR